MYASLTVDLTVGFVLLFVITKLLGKTQLSQITPFTFISALVLGELLGNAVYQQDTTIFHVAFAIALWGTMMVVVELLNQKSPSLRRVLEGTATVLIRKGEIDRKAMGKNKLDINQVQMLLRKQSVFSLREVEYGILESDGSLTVLKKGEYLSPTKQDMQMPKAPTYLAYVVVSDGKLLRHNLEQAGLNELDLRSMLSQQGYLSYEEVFVAEWQQDSGLYIQPKQS